MRTNSAVKNVFNIFNYSIMILISLIFLYPIVYTISVSFSDANSILKGSVVLFPKGLNADAYKLVLSDMKTISALWFTVKLTLSGVVMSLILTTLAAYPLSRSNLKGSGLILGLIVFTMYFDGGLIPNYMMVKNLGLLNNMGSLIFPRTISPFLMIIMMTFFRGIPKELEEAAVIDGCSNFDVFFKIVLPISFPIYATLTIFYAVSYWNTFFEALLYIQNSAKFTLQLRLYQVLNVVGDSMVSQMDASSVSASTVITENMKAATVVVTVLPIICVYPALQKYFVKGATVGAIKG